MFYIVDEVPGAGKTCAAINFINSTPRSSRFLFVTPFISEVERICDRCGFIQPPDELIIEKPDKEKEKRKAYKRVEIRKLIAKGKNIATTHSLFSLFDDQTIEMLRSKNYILILDEALEVVEPWDVIEYDVEMMLNTYCYTDDRGLVKWREDKMDYPDEGGVYSEIKKELTSNIIAVGKNKSAVQMFPIEYFRAFKDVYILTYLFQGSPQRMYFDYHNIEYTKLYISGDSIESYQFTDEPQSNHDVNYSDLITIIGGKINRIGEDQSLSYSWYRQQIESGDELGHLEELAKNTENFYKNKMLKSGLSSRYYLWTTFKDAKKYIKGKTFSERQFLSYTARATNNYSSRKALAYLINKRMNPIIRNFFKAFDITVDEDTYSTNEMIQWIWRSAIRTGEHIYIYIPSLRMRKLLIRWIEDNSNVTISNKSDLLMKGMKLCGRKK